MDPLKIVRSVDDLASRLATQSAPKVFIGTPPPMRPLSMLSDAVPHPAVGFDPIPLSRHAGEITPYERRKYRLATEALAEPLDRGLEMGYASWHNTGPLQDYVRGMFPTVEQGDQRFRELMGITSAASHGTGVPKELQKGTLYHHLLRQGDLPKFRNIRTATSWAQKARDEGLIPEGYGHSMQGNDLLAISKFWDGGLGFPREGKSGEAYKIASYFANKMGDLDPATLDTWMYRMQKAEPGRTQHYGHLEDLLRRLAAERGVQPGQAQPAVWMTRGGEIGVDSLDQPSFMHYLEEMTRKRAAELGEHPENVLRDVILGNQYLYRPDEQMQTQV